MVKNLLATYVLDVIAETTGAFEKHLVMGGVCSVR